MAKSKNIQPCFKCLLFKTPGNTGSVPVILIFLQKHKCRSLNWPSRYPLRETPRGKRSLLGRALCFVCAYDNAVEISLQRVFCLKIGLQVPLLLNNVESVECGSRWRNLKRVSGGSCAVWQSGALSVICETSPGTSEMR